MTEIVHQTRRYNVRRVTADTYQVERLDGLAYGAPLPLGDAIARAEAYQADDEHDAAIWRDAE